MVSFLILFPVFGAVACLLAGLGGKDARNVVASAVTVIEFVMCLYFLSYPDYELRLALAAGEGLCIQIDGFRRIYLVILSFMWAMTMLASHRYFKGHAKTNRFYFFCLVTEGATAGVFMAGNLYTALIFFELMSLASFTWVIQEETEAAIRAAETYLAIAVIGGLCALGGIFLIKNALGTTDIAKLYELASASGQTKTLYTAGILILIGFGAKAGCFPLHIWLPKAHPQAPAPASALLSGILTKSGIFGVIVLSCYLFRGDPGWGTLVLVLGLITMALGAVLALFSVDLKRTLACSSVSQIGFILVGLGMMGLLGEESAIAARGSFLHMLNHSLFKLVLFMCAGVVYQNTHKLNLNDIRGFGRGKLMLTIAFCVAALGIMGFPGFTGYYSKTLLHESMTEYIGILRELGRGTLLMRAAEGLFLLSGGCTVAYMLKLFVCLFIDKHPTRQEQYSRNLNAEGSTATVIALFIPAAVLTVLSLTGNYSLNQIADIGTDFFAVRQMEEAVEFFSWESLEGALISLTIGALLYFFFVRKVLMKERNGDMMYVNRWPRWLDLEELFYRPLLRKWLPTVFGAFAAFFGNNTLSAPAARAVLSASSEAAAVAGENKVLVPAAKGAFAGLKVLTHAVTDIFDACLFGIRRVFFPERHPESERIRAEEISRALSEVGDSGRILHGNLSFALLFLVAAAVGVIAFIVILNR